MRDFDIRCLDPPQSDTRLDPGVPLQPPPPPPLHSMPSSTTSYATIADGCQDPAPLVHKGHRTGAQGAGGNQLLFNLVSCAQELGRLEGDTKPQAPEPVWSLLQIQDALPQINPGLHTERGPVTVCGSQGSVFACADQSEHRSFFSSNMPTTTFSIVPDCLGFHQTPEHL